MWEEQTPQAPAQTPAQKKSNKNLFIYGAIGIVIIILVVVSGYFFIQYQNAQKQLASGGAAEVQKIVDRVGKLVDLPKGEKPTLAAVTDKFKLNNQPFFAKAENGDQVLIYSKNKTAILFRPSTNKIINLATGVTIGQGTSTTPTPAVAGITAAPSEVPTATTAPIPTKAPVKTIPTATPSPTVEATPTP